MGAGAIWLPLFFMETPRAVKLSARIGQVFFGLVLIFCAIGIPGARSSDDREAFAVLATIGVAGIAISIGMLKHKRWAYRSVIAFIWLTVLFAPCLLVYRQSWQQAAWVGPMILALLVWRLVLTGSEVRVCFGLSPQPQLLLAPAWLNLIYGAGWVICVFWPQPTPLFGFWMQSWQTLVFNLAFGVAHLWIGWAMLQPKTVD